MNSDDEHQLFELGERLDELEGRVGRVEHDESLSHGLDELEGRIGHLEDESLSGRLDELKGRIAQLEDGGLSERLEELKRQLGELKGGTAWLEDVTAEVTAAVIYTLGAALGMILSWSRNVSILWCILHGVFSWVYVVYFSVTR